MQMDKPWSNNVYNLKKLYSFLFLALIQYIPSNICNFENHLMDYMNDKITKNINTLFAQMAYLL